MAKSAQEKFNEYLDECRETSNAVRAFVDASYEVHNNYAHAAGFLQSVVQDLISELPRARRAEMRDRLFSQAQKHKNELLVRTIRDSDVKTEIEPHGY